MSGQPDDVLLTQVKQYRLVRELGRGGMGTVYEAEDTRDGGRVAVKLLHPWLAAEDSSFRDRFEREAHIAALLRSPYSVRLLDFGVADGNYYLVMEFVEGSTVGGELKKGPLEPLRALRIGIDVARALEEAAAHGIVHRDIKPDNILLTKDGRVKVTDFGIARSEGGTGLTAAGGFVGTAEFAAPEQVVGDADHRTDIYSLGATLYCMLAGHPPFQAGTVWDVLRQHQTAQVQMGPLTELPDSVVNPIRRCMEKDPRDRYQTATELAGALERAMAGYLHLRDSPTAARGGGGATAGTAGMTPSRPVPPTAPPAAPPTRVAGGGTPPAAPTRPAPAAQGGTAGATPLTMTARFLGPGPGDVSRYELAVSNPGGRAVRVAFLFNEPTGVLTAAVPPAVTIAAGGSQQLQMEVRQVRPAARSSRGIQFQVAAQRDDGSRAAFVNVAAIPVGTSRTGGGRSRGWLVGLGALAVLAVGGAGAAFLALGGSDKDEPTPTPTSTQATTVPGGGGSVTPGATQVTVPSIKVLDRWDFAFRIQSNDCPFGARPGDRYPVSFRFTPATGTATVINDGDRVTVTGVQDRDIHIGTFTFRMVDFEFTYPVAATGGQRGTATVRASFADAVTIGDALLTEKYDSPACTIVGRPAS
ncbi:MAG: serine/threonine protein kinase [Gemmataceae bacterium]|nr:serine/threonine protein kinase [Gemmataceae bacterium]